MKELSLEEEMIYNFMVMSIKKGFSFKDIKSNALVGFKNEGVKKEMEMILDKIYNLHIKP